MGLAIPAKPAGREMASEWVRRAFPTGAEDKAAHENVLSRLGKRNVESLARLRECQGPAAMERLRRDFGGAPRRLRRFFSAAMDWGSTSHCAFPGALELLFVWSRSGGPMLSKRQTSALVVFHQRGGFPVR